LNTITIFIFKFCGGRGGGGGSNYINPPLQISSNRITSQMIRGDRIKPHSFFDHTQTGHGGNAIIGITILLIPFDFCYYPTTFFHSFLFIISITIILTSLFFLTTILIFNILSEYLF
jgi:hypothetical protein